MPVSEKVASQVGENLVHLVKTFSALRQHLPRLHPEVETTAYPIIFTLANGPMRVSAIAERIHSDISTVSRQVSHLVQVGVLDKVADPDDGRAQNVVLASDGKQLLDDIHDSRGRLFASLMSDWTNDEAHEFDRSLRRLHDNLTVDFTTRGAAAYVDAARPLASATSTPLTRKESM